MALRDSLVQANWLADLLRQEPCVLLCGAGVSVESGLPQASDFVEALISGLAKASSEAVPLHAELLRKLGTQRLEWVLKIATQTPLIDPLSCLQALEGASANRLHYFAVNYLSSFCREGGVLLTTNFECLFEDAIQSLGLTPPEVIIGPRLEDKLTGTGVVIVKLHGSLGHDSLQVQRSQLLATIDQVGREFPEQTVAVLDKLLRGKTLLVLGYSGNDHYDIMPYLARHAYKRLIWIQHDKTVKEGYLCPETSPLPLAPRSGDHYFRAHTPLLVQPLCEALQILYKEPDPRRPDWRPKIQEWIDLLGPKALVALADLVMREDEFEIVQRLYQRAIARLDHPSDTPVRVKARRNLGALYAMVGDPHAAIENLERILNEEKEVGPEERSAILIEIGIAYGGLASWGPGMAQLSLRKTQEAAVFAKESGSLRMQASAQRNLGRIYWGMGLNRDLNPVMALAMATRAYESAMVLLEQTNDMERLDLNCADLGSCYLLQGEYWKACEMFISSSWFTRIVAYRDMGRRLRNGLGHVGATAALAMFMGERKGFNSFNDRERRWTWLKRALPLAAPVLLPRREIERVLRDSRILSLNAAAVLRTTILKAHSQQMQWLRVESDVHLYQLVCHQAQELAEGPLAGWKLKL